MNSKDIQVLLEKFFNAETTLEEEQELYDFFAQAEIPDELKPYQEMFWDYACIETINVSAHNIIDTKPKINKWKYIGIAASVIIVFSIGFGLFHQAKTDYAVAYINDEKISDENVALNIGCSAVSDIFSNEDNAKEELHDIFNPD